MDSLGHIKWNRHVHETGVTEVYSSEQLDRNKSAAVAVQDVEDGIVVVAKPIGVVMDNIYMVLKQILLH